MPIALHDRLGDPEIGFAEFFVDGALLMISQIFHALGLFHLCQRKLPANGLLHIFAVALVGNNENEIVLITAKFFFGAFFLEHAHDVTGE